MIRIPPGGTTPRQLANPDQNSCKITQDLIAVLRQRRSGAITRRTFLKRWGELRTSLAATPAYKKMRSRVAKRAGGMCQVEGCGRRGELIHHMKQVSKAPDLVMDESNVIWICRKCHKKIHPHLSRSS